MRWACIILALLIASPALAHKASDAYLRLEPVDGAVHGSLDLALRDLEPAIGLDADLDGAITWGELKSRHDALEAYVRGRLQFTSPDGPCTLDGFVHRVDRHSDGAYAVLDFATVCPDAGLPASLRYDLLFDIDPTHRGLLRLGADDAVTTTVLAPDRPVVPLDFTATAGHAGFVAFFLHGTEHILAGIDHLLFLLVVLLPVAFGADGDRRGKVLDIVRVLTAFTIAHGLSLALAVTGLVQLPSRLVESAIAATIVLTALDNIKPWLPWPRWAVAFGFGLIHGLGFASALGPLDLPGRELASALLGFNLGIEAIQIVLAVALLGLAWAMVAASERTRICLPAGSALAMLLAGAWFVERAFALRA